MRHLKKLRQPSCSKGFAFSVHGAGGLQVRSAVARCAATSGAGIVDVILDLETLLGGKAVILQRFRAVLHRFGARIKLAVLDHITSAPTVHLPISEIAAACADNQTEGQNRHNLAKERSHSTRLKDEDIKRTCQIWNCCMLVVSSLLQQHDAASALLENFVN